MMYVDTGSTLLNLACSNKADGGFALGTMVNIIGDSSSGKTMLALSALGGTCYRPEFDNYARLFDDVEAANSFDMKAMFGEKAAEKIISPYEEDMSTDMVEAFYYTLDRLFDAKDPFLYVLDSMDALETKADTDKFVEERDAFEKGKEVKGSYGVTKAKANSRGLSQIVRKLRDKQSLLMIISQTRDNITSMFKQSTRSGGKALKFYATHEIWTCNMGKIKKTIDGKPRVIGHDIRVKITKNKLTGKECEIDFPIRYGYGIDDIASCLDYLVAEDVWKLEGKTKIANSLTEAMSREKLIEHIEEKDQVPTLRKVVEEHWLSIEDLIKPKRKAKFF